MLNSLVESAQKEVLTPPLHTSKPLFKENFCAAFRRRVATKRFNRYYNVGCFILIKMVAQTNSRIRILKMKYNMILWIISLNLLIVMVNSSTVFVKPIRAIGKQDIYLKLHGVVKDKRYVTMEDKLSAVVKEEPILAIQTISNSCVYIAGVSQLLSWIPDSFENKLRLQCLMMLSSSTLLDIMRYLQISPYEIRDDYFMNDLLDQAITEMKSLATDTTSLTLSYYLICMTTHQSAKGCLIPFLIRELPNLIQISVITWLLSQSNTGEDDKNPIPAALTWLFNPTTTTTTNTATTTTATTTGTVDSNNNNNINTINTGMKNIVNINKISNTIADIMEIYITMNSFFNLLFSSKTQNIRSILDMFILTIQILLIQNYITKRIKLLLILENKNIINNYLLNNNTLEGAYNKIQTLTKAYWKQLFHKKQKKIYKTKNNNTTTTSSSILKNNKIKRKKVNKSTGTTSEQ